MKIEILINQDKFLARNTELIEIVNEDIKKEVYRIFPLQKYLPLPHTFKYSKSDNYLGIKIYIEVEFPIQHEWNF